MSDAVVRVAVDMLQLPRALAHELRSAGASSTPIADKAFATDATAASPNSAAAAPAASAASAAADDDEDAAARMVAALLARMGSGGAEGDCLIAADAAGADLGRAVGRRVGAEKKPEDGDQQNAEDVNDSAPAASDDVLVIGDLRGVRLVATGGPSSLTVRGCRFVACAPGTVVAEVPAAVVVSLAGLDTAADAASSASGADLAARVAAPVPAGELVGVPELVLWAAEAGPLLSATAGAVAKRIEASDGSIRVELRGGGTVGVGAVAQAVATVQAKQGEQPQGQQQKIDLVLAAEPREGAQRDVAEYAAAHADVLSYATAEGDAAAAAAAAAAVPAASSLVIDSRLASKEEDAAVSLPAAARAASREEVVAALSLLGSDGALYRAVTVALAVWSWVPTAREAASSQMAAFAATHGPAEVRAALDGGKMEELHPLHWCALYKALHAWSISSTEATSALWSAVWDFCGAVGEKGDAPFLVADAANLRNSRFFPNGAKVNLARNMLRAAVYAPERPALVFRCEGDALPRREITFGALARLTRRAAAKLAALGVGRGDRVGSSLPNMPEAVIYNLAAASLGAVWTAVTPDAGDKVARDRIGQVDPKVVVVADRYFYNGRECTPRASPDAFAPGADVITIPGEGEGDDAPEQESGIPPCEDMSVQDPVYILFTSGTTGKPKAIVQGFGVHLNHLKETMLHCGISRNEGGVSSSPSSPAPSVAMAYTNAAWMIWHWLVSSLATGTTVVLYDGSPAPGGDWNGIWNVVAEERVSYFGVGARLIDGCRQAKGLTLPPLPHLRVMTSTGSPLSVVSANWVMRDRLRGVRLSSISGGTEINGCLALGAPIVPVRENELQVAPLGMDVDVVVDSGAAGKPPRRVLDTAGELVCFNPFPSMPVYFFGADGADRYRRAYFDTFGDHLWAHGDVADRTPRGGFIIRGRSDATLNPGGVRLGTSEYYELVAEQFAETVSDSVVVDVEGTGVVLFVVPVGATAASEAPAALAAGVQESLTRAIRMQLSPKHTPRAVVPVRGIPYNANQKKMEVIVRHIANGAKPDAYATMLESVTDPATVTDFVQWAAAPKV